MLRRRRMADPRERQEDFIDLGTVAGAARNVDIWWSRAWKKRSTEALMVSVVVELFPALEQLHRAIEKEAEEKGDESK
jgi:hypothetical protein